MKDQPPSLPRPSSHPRSCRACHGTGWMDGPPIPYRDAHGPGEYTTVTPCTHPWRQDDPSVDDHGLSTHDVDASSLFLFPKDL